MSIVSFADLDGYVRDHSIDTWEQRFGVLLKVKRTLRQQSQAGLAYQVGVECWENPPSMDGGGPPVSYVSKAYESSKTSGLEVTVKPGDRLVEVTFDVPKR